MKKIVFLGILLVSSVHAVTPPLAGDAQVSQGGQLANNNYGSAATVNVGAGQGQSINRGLFQFQLNGALPPGTTAAQITKANLYLSRNSTLEAEFSVS